MTWKRFFIDLKKDWKLTPNIITLSRFILGIIPIILLVMDNFITNIICLLTFIVLAGTDWVDGYIARKTGQVTELGRFLDPLADTFLYSSLIIILLIQNIGNNFAFLFLWFLVYSLLVFLILKVGNRKNMFLKPNIFGKIKAWFLTLLIVIFMAIKIPQLEFFGSYVKIVIIITLILSFSSLFTYFYSYFIRKNNTDTSKRLAK